MLKADGIVRGWALRAVENGGARAGDDVADQLHETASRFESRSGTSTKRPKNHMPSNEAPKVERRRLRRNRTSGNL